MTITGSVDIYVDRSIGAEVGKEDDGGVYIDVVAEVGSGNDKVSESEVGEKGGYWGGGSVNKGVKNGVGVWVGAIVGLGVYRVFGSAFGSSYGITVGIDDGYEVGSYNGSFYGSNVLKPVGSFIDESLE